MGPKPSQEWSQNWMELGEHLQETSTWQSNVYIYIYTHLHTYIKYIHAHMYIHVMYNIYIYTYIYVAHKTKLMGMNIHLLSGQSATRPQTGYPLADSEQNFRCDADSDKKVSILFRPIFQCQLQSLFFSVTFPFHPYLPPVSHIANLFDFFNHCPKLIPFLPTFHLFHSFPMKNMNPFISSGHSPSLVIPHPRPWSNIPSFRAPARRHGISSLHFLGNFHGIFMYFGTF